MAPLICCAQVSRSAANNCRWFSRRESERIVVNQTGQRQSRPRVEWSQSAKSGWRDQLIKCSGLFHCSAIAAAANKREQREQKSALICNRSKSILCVSWVSLPNCYYLLFVVDFELGFAFGLRSCEIGKIIKLRLEAPRAQSGGSPLAFYLPTG